MSPVAPMLEEEFALHTARQRQFQRWMLAGVIFCWAVSMLAVVGLYFKG